MSLFHKTILTCQSRSKPCVMEAYYNYTKSLYLTTNPKDRDYYTALILLCDSLRYNYASYNMNYLLINQIKQLLVMLNISL